MQKFRDGKTIKKLFTTCGLFLIVFGVSFVFSSASVMLFHSVMTRMDQKAVDRIFERAQHGIAAEADHLMKQSREMDEFMVFDRLLAKNDSAGLISISTEEAKKRDVGGILIADKKGQVLSRTASDISQRGDFIFHSTFWGREIFEHGESYGVEKDTTQPFIIYGAKKLEREGELFGAIVSLQIPDDDYARAFVDKYLPRGTHIAFYAKERGLIGSDFESLEERRLFEIYFAPQSKFNEQHKAQIKTTVNGEHYIAKNVVFESGHDGYLGNMILFIPHNPGKKALAASAFATLVFILAFFIAFRLGKPKCSTVFTVLLAVAAIAIVFILSYFFVKAIYDKEYTSLSAPPQIIYNATIAINPDSSAVDLSHENIVSVDIRTGGESINVVDATLQYDPTIARVVAIRTTRSFCHHDFFIEREIDNEKGKVHVVCGLPTPGFNELQGNVFELVFQPLISGRLIMRFGEETKILANDGLGTDVLRNSTDASFLIAEEGRSRVFIFSPSHPNITRWYNNRQLLFVWVDFDSRKYSYVLDKKSDTKPNEEGLIDDTSASFEVPEDGLYYFHLLYKDKDGTSPVSHYPVRIDSTPPEAPLINASASEAAVGDVIRFDFSSKDELGGFHRAFYVKLRKDGVFFPTGRQLFVAFPKKGEHTVTVRVFDRANNYSESQKVIKIK